MGRGTSWNPHDVDVAWLGGRRENKDRNDKLAARVVKVQYQEARGPFESSGFTALPGAQVDELRAELPTLHRVSVAVVAQKLGTSSSTVWRVLHNRLREKPTRVSELSGSQLPPVSVAWRSVAVSVSVGARLRLCKGPSLPTLNLQRVCFSDEKVYKCEYLQHPQNFRYWVDRTRKSMDCADLTGRNFNPGIMVAMVVWMEWHRRRTLCGTRGQGQQCLLTANTC